MYSRNLISASVGEIHPNGEGNPSLILQATAGKILPAYSAGAYIDTAILSVNPQQHSLCSTPDRSNTYEIYVRLTNTFTDGPRYLYQQVKSGNWLAISPPCNYFPLSEAGRYLLFVDGIDITPLLAIAKAIVTRKGTLGLHYYIVNSRQTAFSPRLTQLAAGGTVAIRCNEEGTPFRQRIPAYLTTPNPDTAVVAYGPEGFTQRLQSVMGEYRWLPSQFVFECPTPAAKNNIMAKNAFYIELASGGQCLQVATDQTVAQVLQHAGMGVMLSCGQRTCESRIAGVLGGTPEHRGSVLTAEEKAGNNQITLCCLWVRSPVLVLDL